MDFNSNILFNNISYLLKHTDKRVGELESESGVSTGYISRTSKDSGANPSIEFVFKTANFFKVGIDLLVSVDLGNLTETELYISKFIDKLIKDTNNGTLDWIVEKANDLNTLDSDINGLTEHDLFYHESFLEETESGYPEEISDVRFKSDSFGYNTYINKDCYILHMKDYSLHVMNICKSVHRNRPDEFAIELWMVKDRGESRLLVKNLNNPVHKSLIDSLYSSISEYAKKPKIDSDIKRVLDAYMYEDDLDDDNMYINSDSNRIPF